MTNEAYAAKQWLYRLFDLYDQAEKTRHEIEDLESRINNAVSNYENIGRGQADLIVRQQQHEDALIDYSIKKEQYENEYYQFIRQEMATLNIIDRLSDYTHRAILIDRYINRSNWKTIEKLYSHHCKRSQLFRLHKNALEELAGLLTTEEPKAIEEADKALQEARARLNNQQTA